MLKLIDTFLKDEEGASAVEYAILVAAIAGVVSAAVATFDLDDIFTTVEAKIDAIIDAI